MPNYSFVIDSSFKPFSFEEMLRPWAMYSAASEKVEEAYDEINRKANLFSYLEDTLKNNPEDRAAQIYKNYMDEFNKQEQDFAKNGLSISNRRGLLGLKRRFQGEIGQLEQADVQLKELQKQRNALAAAGKNILYGNDNPTLSDLLPGNNSFNRYAIDSADLRARGNSLGKAISSRIYDNEEGGSALQGQYKLWTSTHGISPNSIAAFMQSKAVQDTVDQELIANGAASNLSGRNLEIARQNILNGIYEGIVYEESVKPLENKDYIDAATKARLSESARSTDLQGALYGKKWNGKEWVDDSSMLNVKSKTGKNGSGTSSSKGSGDYNTVNKKPVRLSWNGDNPNDLNGDADDDLEAVELDTDDKERVGIPYRFDALPQYAKDKVRAIIGPNGNTDHYEYYFKPYQSSWLGDTEAELDIVPRDIKKYSNAADEMEIDFNAVGNVTQE